MQKQKEILMKKMLLTALAALALATATWAADAPATAKVDGKTAFEKLKTLAGNWDGMGDQGMPVPVNYKVTGGGSVVMETLFAGTPHEMVTMYHLDGGDLVATHYCAGGNQPHLKLDTGKSTPDHLILSFAGGSNLDPAKDNYMHDGKLAFTPDGHLDAEWDVYAAGQPAGSHVFHLTRAAAK
jgi:hypothetical protein